MSFFRMSSYGAIDLSLEEPDELLVRSLDPVLLNPNIRRGIRDNTPQSRRPYIYSHRSVLEAQAATPSASTDSTVFIRDASGNIGTDGQVNALTQSSSQIQLHREHNMAIRYRLFNRLDPGGRHLIMPAHLILSELFSILPFSDFKDQQGKQGSIVTIFSIWNTMMGTSLLAMPWALQQAGFALGLFLILAMALLAFYTAYRVIESPNGLVMPGTEEASAEFSDVCRYFYGKSGEFVATFFSIIVLFGGVIVYFVLMSNFLFFTGNIVYESLQPNSSIIPIMTNKTFSCDIYCAEENEKIAENFTQIGTQLGNMLSVTDLNISFTSFWKLQGSVPIILGFLTFPLLNFKSPTFFTKFNVLGTISIFYLLIFTFSKLMECGINVDFMNVSSVHFVQLYNSKFPALTGTLALSYFIHNAILTILRNQKNPANNARDLSIGYVLVATCYVLIGVMFFIAFPVWRSCISDNFLNNFGIGDVMSATARVFLLFQMFTVLPLLLYLVRVQFSYVFAGTVYPGSGYVCLINFGVVTVAMFFAIVYPHVGSILRLFGSVSGFVYIFTLPCLVHMRRLEQQGRLTKTQIVIHCIIIVIGVLNLVSQFLIKV